MKNTFKIAAMAALMAGFAHGMQAQKAADATSKIELTAFVGEQPEAMPGGAAAMLENKLGQVLSQNGLSSAAFNSRFIITPHITVLTKDLTATAPPMTALTLEVTLAIGDGFEGRKFATQSLTVKGVGTNENKAYIEAIKQINPSNPALQAFLATGKSKILDYYNTKCPTILQQAKALESQNKIGEALYMLTTVPDAAADCYKKSMAAAEPLYKKQIEQDCKTRLMEAQTVWNANQNYEGAQQAGEILAGIDPLASCYGDVKALAAKIGKRVQEIDKREWQLTVDQEVGLERDRIKAMRDIGVAWGKGQPKTQTTNYIVKGWW